MSVSAKKTTKTTRQYRHAIPTMMRLKREPSFKDVVFKPQTPFPNAEMVLQKIKSEGNMNPSTQDLANALFIECNKWLKANGFKEFVPSQNLGWTLKDGVISRPGAKVCFDARSISRQQSAHKILSETIKQDGVQL
ncbi:hypothetical protein H8356DRAFT_545945 [Neocallimastix lanati (nom. inval.)]|jgi:hypothetical protein|uniref:Uncharacterized protein n=1 Tax=Neocallimastix californiae TaxID=1754190 RepID=A0A1Y2FQC4_9FUNG|nr:hypothetical protein H8356DRAFT_545945 [Neocallimastix sp. JGI-2020a]ORY85797.1 hypothetical protein LY90DRAFT_498893 [Neocallimastix californiae]|eukprot:ORY85797.1 hypothetical protein LY90DRAFT_498893 [Neocallimastix californiae]